MNRNLVVFAIVALSLAISCVAWADDCRIKEAKPAIFESEIIGYTGKEAWVVIVDLSLKNEKEQAVKLNWKKGVPILRVLGDRVEASRLLISNWLPMAGGVGPHAAATLFGGEEIKGFLELDKDTWCRWLAIGKPWSKSGDHVSIPVKSATITVTKDRPASIKLLFPTDVPIPQAELVVPGCSPSPFQLGGSSSMKTKVYEDAKNGYFMFLPPKGWTPQLYADPRTKVAFNHPNTPGVFIRFIVREAPGETYDAMIREDKTVSNQMRRRGILCEVKEKEIKNLRYSEVLGQFPNDEGTWMLRKFLSCGLHFNIQYSATTKTLFYKHLDETMKSLETITVMKVAGGDVAKAREQQIAGRLRLAKLTAQWVSIEEATQILKEAQKDFPKSRLIQDALREIQEKHNATK